ncbi:L,D-transpeptidase family protein [Arenibacterium sp. CAU 1754]
MRPPQLPFLARSLVAFTCALFLSLGVMSAPARAQVTAFKQAVAEAASADADIAKFYRSTGFAPLWTGQGDDAQQRRAALVAALKSSHLHGLAPARYDLAGLLEQLKNAQTARDLGDIEVALSTTYLRYARDVQSGLLVPGKIDSGMVRDVKYRDRTALLTGFAENEPRDFLNSLPPANSEYRNLMKEKLRLERVMESGGWGATVKADKLEPGDTGPAVVALRNRLIAMGYMSRSAARDYDGDLQQGVRDFQAANGLAQDGVAGAGTLRELNTPVRKRLHSIVVAMERERWMNFDRGTRHILVNQTDFTARIIDKGEVTFQTRTVIGKNTSDRRSPEFSDVMEHMIINPTWYVPRSIVTKEYLPKLRNNPNAVQHLVITDSRGRRVNRSSVDFSQFTQRNFPFAMSQPPSNRNALGLVKFMFPNKYNIYLHDTPQKSLFSHETRAFSHGCIRLADPFDFAYALLAAQEDNPRAFFHSILNTGRETKVPLKTPVPVHLIYRTAFTSPKGRAEFRRDVYNRDGLIWEALSRAGVELSDVQG